MNLRDAHEQTKRLLAEQPQLKDDGEEFRMLWSCSSYDGPTSGVCLVRGSPHWFERTTEWPASPNKLWFDRPRPPQFTRIFAVAALTPQEFEIEERRQQEWEACFGKRRYAYQHGKRTRDETSILRTEKERIAFYNHWRLPNRHYQGKEVIGWWVLRVINFDVMLSSVHQQKREKA